MKNRPHYFVEDPAGFYRLLAATTDPHSALVAALNVALGTEIQDPEELLDAVRSVVQRAAPPAEELEELRTQLQLCNLAALTGTDVSDIRRQDPGWSEAYENVKALHLKYRALSEFNDSLPWPIITAYEFWAAVKKELASK